MSVTCLYCGKRLSVVQTVSGQGFCSRTHRADYTQLQETLALERLREMPKAERELPLAPWAAQEVGRRKGLVGMAAMEAPGWEAVVPLPQLLQQIQAHSERTRLTTKEPRAGLVECGPRPRQGPAKGVRIEAEADFCRRPAMPGLDGEWGNPIDRMPRRGTPVELGMLWARGTDEPVMAPAAWRFGRGGRA